MLVIDFGAAAGPRGANGHSARQVNPRELMAPTGIQLRRILYGFERKSQRRQIRITPVFMAARNAKQQPIGRHRPFETAARHPPRCHRTILLAIQEVPGPPIPAPPANPWKNAGRDAKESHRGAPTGSPACRRPQLPLRNSLLSTLASTLPRIGCKDCAYPRSQKGAPTHHPRNGGCPRTCRCPAGTSGGASPSRESRRKPQRDQRHGGFALLSAGDRVRYARRGGRAS